MNITLTQIDYLMAIAEEGSLSKAAERCFVTQPSLSMQLKKIESEAGALLVDRSRKPLRLTEAGELFLSQARNIKAEVQVLKDLMLDYQDSVEGHLRIGVIPTIAPYLVPLFIGSFSKQYPKLQVSLRELKTSAIVRALKEDRLDVGIAATPLKEPEIKESPLYHERFFAYGSFEGKQSTTLEELMQDRFWVLEEGNCFRTQAFNLCQMEPLNWNLAYDGGNIETLKRMVDVEGGSTLLPQMATQGSAGKICPLLTQDHKSPVRQVSLLTYRSQLKKKLIGLLRKHILETLPPEIAQNQKDVVVSPI